MKTHPTRTLIAGALAGALTAGLTVGSAHAALHAPGLSAASAPAVRPVVFGATTAGLRDGANANRRKFDGHLAQVAGAVGGLKAGTAMSALHDLDPSVRFRTSAPNRMPEVLVDVIANGDAEALKTGLVGLGLEDASSFSNDVGGWLPVEQLDAVAALGEVRLARSARPRTRAGAVLSQGDFIQRSDVVRAMSPTFDGRGVTVGVLSDSYDCYGFYERAGTPGPSGDTGYASNGFQVDATKDVASGDVSASVSVLKEANCADYGAPQYPPFSDEGRAILQIVHDVAPGASLSFYTGANSEADFANGIVALARNGATVIDDDLGYPDEPFFQDGLIAQAVNRVAAGGVAYFSSAGNDGRNSYENAAPQFPVTAAAETKNQGEKLLNFDASGSTTTTVLPITIPTLSPGEFIELVLEWDQPYVTGSPNSNGSTNTLDLCLTDASGVIQNCSGPNAGRDDPISGITIGNPANSGADMAAQQAGIVIGLASGAAPGLVKFVLLDGGAGGTINRFQTNSPTLQGHPGAGGAAAVAAAFFYRTPRCGTSPVMVESFSSAGSDPILFDNNGQRLAQAVIRQKPDFTAADGGNDTFLGFTLADAGYPNGQLSTSTPQCQNDSSHPNFFGTSAAAPHAAGIAALFLQAKPTLTPNEIISALRNTALPMTTAGFDYNAGAGLIQADAAFNSLGLTAPVASPSPAPSPSPSPSPSGSSDHHGGGAFGLIELAWLGALLRRRRRAR